MEGVDQGSELQTQLFDLFLYLGAEWILELLVILSVISVAITAERIFHFLSHRDDYDMLQKELDAQKISRRLAKRMRLVVLLIHTAEHPAKLVGPENGQRKILLRQLNPSDQ
mgnify:CR=1 FL=1